MTGTSHVSDSNRSRPRCAVQVAAQSRLFVSSGSQAVTVRLTCTLDLSFISFGAMHVTGYAVAPLDQYVGRTYG